MQATVILAIIELIAKYGIPAVRDAIQEWNKDVITEEDIKHLADRIKHPSEY